MFCLTLLSAGREGCRGPEKQMLVLSSNSIMWLHLQNVHVVLLGKLK